jgi:hypothetical protein
MFIWTRRPTRRRGEIDVNKKVSAAQDGDHMMQKAPISSGLFSFGTWKDAGNTQTCPSPPATLGGGRAWCPGHDVPCSSDNRRVKCFIEH